MRFAVQLPLLNEPKKKIWGADLEVLLKNER
jgi:hypothetical protein